MVDLVQPVSEHADPKRRGRSKGIGLAISGGGYRAMLFHLGAFVRLHEIGLLQRLDRISSVSGGSITAAKVALEWPRLTDRAAFFTRVVAPIRRLAGIPVDVPSILAGVILPGTVADYVALAYRRFLFGSATLQDLPKKPEFVINATNVELATLWRFTRASMGDWRAGYIPHPTLSLSRAVAASSAFPPVLSPLVLDVEPSDFAPAKEPIDPVYQSGISLTDGGVYDNLGLERIWKAYDNVLVSDAGGGVGFDPSPSAAWGRQAMRVIGIIHGQVGSLRKRQLIASYKARTDDPARRRGTYWGIGSDVDHYHLPDALPAPHKRTEELARVRTALWCLDAEMQERLINWGYAICDTAIRKHFREGGTVPPPAFPYPRGV